MKKKLSMAITCLFIMFLLFSCDGSLNKILEVFNGNAFIDAGWIQVDTSTVNAIFNEKVETAEATTSEDGKTTTITPENGAKIAITKNEDGSSTIKLGDTPVNIDSEDNDLEDAINNGTILAPMTDAGLAAFNKKVTEVVQSPQKQAVFIAELKKPADEEATKNTKTTFGIASALANTVSKDITDENLKGVLNSIADMAKDVATEETVTKSDEMKAQLMVGIVSTAASLKDSGSDDNKKAELTTSIINQASTLITISKQEAGNFDILQIEGLDSFISNLFKEQESNPQPQANAEAKNIEAKELEDTDISSKADEIKKYLPLVRGILKDLFGFNGTSFNKNSIETALSNYREIEIANRIIVANANEEELSKYTIGKTIDYALGFILYQLNEIDKTLQTDSKFDRTSLYVVLNDFVAANKWITDNEAPIDKIVYPESVNKIMKELGVEDGSFDINSIINTTDGAIINKDTLLNQAKNLDLVIKNISTSIPEDFSVEKLISDMLNAENK